MNRNRDRGLHEADVRQLGSWREALAAAGINFPSVTHRRPKNLDREAMLLWLRNRQSAGQSVIWTDVCLENRDYALAIRREFGSWRNAIQAAGVQSGM